MPLKDLLETQNNESRMSIRLNETECHQLETLRKEYGTTRSKLVKALVAQEYLNLKAAKRKK